MSLMDDEITKLTSDVAAEKTVVDSAVVLLNGIPTAIQAAVSSALAAGATPAQLQAITDLSTAVEQQSANLAAAVTANTPAPTP